MTEPEKKASQNETGSKAWLKALNETYPPVEIPPESDVFKASQMSIKMTDKETEIKALASTLFELKEVLNDMLMRNANQSYEERKKVFVECEWLHYLIKTAENNLRKATI